MANPLLVVTVTCVAAASFAVSTLPSGRSTRVETRVELPQVGEEADRHNPPCGAQVAGFIAHDVVLKAGAAAIDAYIGSPVSGPVLSVVPPGNRAWLDARVGVPREGPSTCATLCVTYPKTVSATVEACMTESGGDRRDCATSSKDYTDQYGRLDTFTSAITDEAIVTCVVGKNWSHERNRWFSVSATY